MIKVILIGAAIVFVYLLVEAVIVGIFEHLHYISPDESFILMFLWPIVGIVLPLVGIWILGRTCGEWIMDKLEGIKK